MNSPLSVTPSGNVVTTPHVIRGSVTTAYVALTGGTKTELVAGNSSYYLDLVQISFGNQSSAATQLTLLDESTTVQVFTAPLTNTVTHTFPTPLQQNAKGTSWYVDLPDISGTTVNVQALFIQRTS